MIICIDFSFFAPFCKRHTLMITRTIIIYRTLNEAAAKKAASCTPESSSVCSSALFSSRLNNALSNKSKSLASANVCFPIKRAKHLQLTDFCCLVALFNAASSFQTRRRRVCRAIEATLKFFGCLYCLSPVVFYNLHSYPRLALAQKAL